MIVMDIGNSDTVIGIYKKKKLYKTYRIETKNKNFKKNISEFFKKNIIFNLKSNEKICLISSVVPEVNKIIFFLLKKYSFKIKNININNIPKKIKFKYSKNQLGADRIANSFSGVNKYGSNLMIIDFGTATTFDVIAKDGSYEGGVIAPGVNLSLEALHQAAAQLPRVAIRKPEKVIAQETVSAMEAGVYWGYLGLIEGIVKRMQKEYHIPMNVIATGGLAPLFANGTKSINVVDLDLTIKGLLEIYKLNTQQSI